MRPQIQLAAVCLALLGGCVSSDPAIREPHAYLGAARPLSEIATLVAAVDEVPLIAVFQTIDGIKVTSGGAGASKAYVLPGTHRIVVFGHTGSAVLYPTELVADLAASHTYKLRYRIVADERGKESAQFWFDDLGPP